MWRWAALILVVPSVLLAGQPDLEEVYPTGIAPGGTNTLTLFGKFDPWPPQAWCSGEGVSFQFETNKGKVVASVAPGASPGPRLIRIYNDEGVSDPRIIVIAEQPETLEQEPNNHYASAQPLANLPLHLSGRLEKKGDVDSFLLHLRAGEWLDASIASYTLLNKLDPVLRLLTTNGFQLEWNHDFASLDPRLVWRSPKDQSVVLQVFGFVYPANSEIQLSGGAGGGYRLHVAVSRSNPLQLETCVRTNLAFGDSITAAISPDTKQHRYAISLRKDQWLGARASVTDIGSRLDPWIAVSDSAGKELTRNDDVEGVRDARLDWKVPSDGDYILSVGSLTSGVKNGAAYRLTVRELKPDYTAEIVANASTIAPGETNQIKLTVKRLHGLTNELSFTTHGLPDGIRSDGPKPDLKGGEVLLGIIADTNAPPTNVTFRILGKDTISGETRVIPFELVSRSQNNGVPGGYSALLVETLEDLWLTVRPKPKP